MTYEEALAFWHGRIDYERRQPKPGDLKLDRMRALLRKLGDPHRRLRCVHVAGTKGKGSTCAMLAGVLRAAGYRTGLFTSPHLSDVSERVQVDGVPIAPAEIAARMGEVAAAVGELDREGDPARSPTFFEVITALGFLHFDCRRVDVAVLEVGLGGRFDSTNVCEPVLSILTNISHDHTAILGDTPEAIAYQKAGIIKRGVPVVTTADHAAVVAVIEREAVAQHTSVFRLDRDFVVKRLPGKPFEAAPIQTLTWASNWGLLPLGLYGNHQAANAAGVLAAVDVLRKAGLRIPFMAAYDGLLNVVWPARMELISRDPVVVLDCAHNVASARALVDTLRTSFPVKGRKHLLFSTSSDKQIPEMLAVLAPQFDTFHLTRYESNPRSADPKLVAELLAGLGKTEVHLHATPAVAWRAVRDQARPNDAIVIAGSVFLAGEVRPLVMVDRG